MEMLVCRGRLYRAGLSTLRCVSQKPITSSRTFTAVSFKRVQNPPILLTPSRPFHLQPLRFSAINRSEIEATQVRSVTENHIVPPISKDSSLNNAQSAPVAVNPTVIPTLPSRTWVDKYLPAFARPYAKLMRIDRPIGTWLLLFPCYWSLAFAMPPASVAGVLGALPDPQLVAMFAAGAFVMRGAGCTINDMWDRELDKSVARTKDRPLASGAISPFKALCFLAAQLFIGLAVLLHFNDASIVLATLSLPLVFAYPLAKRFTNYPQLILGMAFNWGALVGWTALCNSTNWAVVLPLYAAGISWTLVYDTIYAHQDKDDDKVMGMRSTALHFGDQSRKILSAYAAVTTAALAVSGYAASAGIPFYLLGVGGAAAHMYWQLSTVNFMNGPDCMNKFVSNKWVGLIVLSGIVLDKLLS